MRVTHVVRQFTPSVGGLEEAVLKLCGTLQARGIAVDIVTLDRIEQDGPPRLTAEALVAGLPVRRIPFRGSFRYPVAPGVLAQLGPADVVHVHGIDFFFDFLAATWPLHRKPLVASTHGGFGDANFAQRGKTFHFQTVTRIAARAYRAIFASSEIDLSLFHPIVPPRKLHLLADGVDTAKWRDRASRPPKPHLLYVGRFSTNKNLASLFPLLRALRRIDPAWRLTIAGQPSGLAAASLRIEAEAHGVGVAVSVIEKPSDDTVATIIGQASYFVSPSRHEGFGMSVVEGLSAGLVPILSRIPPFLAILAESGVGLAADFDDAAATAEAIADLHRTLVSGPAAARTAAIAAASRYSWESAAETIQGCYEDMVRRRAMASPRASAHITS